MTEIIRLELLAGIVKIPKVNIHSLFFENYFFICEKKSILLLSNIAMK